MRRFDFRIGLSRYARRGLTTCISGRLKTWSYAQAFRAGLMLMSVPFGLKALNTVNRTHRPSASAMSQMRMCVVLSCVADVDASDRARTAVQGAVCLRRRHPASIHSCRTVHPQWSMRDPCISRRPLVGHSRGRDTLCSCVSSGRCYSMTPGAGRGRPGAFAKHRDTQ